MLPALGHVTANAKAVATAASTALPPCFNVSTPTSEANLEALETIPFLARTGVRPPSEKETEINMKLRIKTRALLD